MNVIENAKWSVRLRIGWHDLVFEFSNAESAEAFARTAAETFIPQDEKFSVSVFATIAENIVEEQPKEEPAEC